MAKEIILTPTGYEKLKKELEELKGPVRTNLAEAIREAKSHGDLKENAAYHEAKLNQSRIEGRINELEKLILVAKVVEAPESDGETAQLGSAVKLKDLEWGDELMVKLVGSFEADPANDLISISSPLGEGLVGRTVGDFVEVEAPAGTQRYQILSVD